MNYLTLPFLMTLIAVKYVLANDFLGVMSQSAQSNEARALLKWSV